MRAKIFLIFISIFLYIYAFSFLKFNYISYRGFKHYFSTDFEKFLFFALFFVFASFCLYGIFYKKKSK